MNNSQPFETTIVTNNRNIACALKLAVDGRKNNYRLERA